MLHPNKIISGVLSIRTQTYILRSDVQFNPYYPFYCKTQNFVLRRKRITVLIPWFHCTADRRKREKILQLLSKRQL